MLTSDTKQRLGADDILQGSEWLRRQGRSRCSRATMLRNECGVELGLLHPMMSSAVPDRESTLGRFESQGSSVVELRNLLLRSLKLDFEWKSRIEGIGNCVGSVFHVRKRWCRYRPWFVHQQPCPARAGDKGSG
mmetsp:Transcript_29970/g.99263  ORF Transcript_29970/g.99263 Transcript_29970/m.99263 type:complete len:134 (+) Transcript_29970:432-833(+)